MKNKVSFTEYLCFDLFVLGFQGAVYFTTLAGPVYVLWRFQNGPVLGLLAIALLAFPIAALIFMVLLVSVKRFLIGQIPERGRFAMSDRRALRWSAGVVLMMIMWRSPFWKLVTNNIALRHIFYRGMGGNVGLNFNPTDALISEPWSLTVGKNVMVGAGAEIAGHKIERGMVSLGPVELGDDVLIGGHAIIFPNVKIGAGAQVGAGAVVLNGTEIPPGETWSGNPARKQDPFGRVQSRAIKTVSEREREAQSVC